MYSCAGEDPSLLHTLYNFSYLPCSTAQGASDCTRLVRLLREVLCPFLQMVRTPASLLNAVLARKGAVLRSLHCNCIKPYSGHKLFVEAMSETVLVPYAMKLSIRYVRIGRRRTERRQAVLSSATDPRQGELPNPFKCENGP
jgi:hypothetical protein